MKNLKTGLISISNSSYNSKIPVCCPYCSAFVEPHQVGSNQVKYNSSYVAIVTFKVNCCSKLFLTTYEFTSKNSQATLLSVYPEQQPDPLPEVISDLSPRFAELYKQASIAETKNHLELAGAGYRNALEVLVKDFAVNVLTKPDSEVFNKSLYSAIGEYVPDITIAADVVRVLGNDYTHYERRYDGIDFDILKKYLHIFIKQIEVKCLLHNPVVETNRP